MILPPIGQFSKWVVAHDHDDDDDYDDDDDAVAAAADDGDAVDADDDDDADEQNLFLEQDTGLDKGCVYHISIKCNHVFGVIASC